MLELLFLGSLLIAAVAALLLAPLMRAWALRVNFLDAPGPRKIHTAPVPYGGGAAVLLAMAFALAVIWGFGSRYFPAGQGSRDDLRGAPVLAVCIGALGAFGLGLFDDRRRLSPLAKLCGQTVLAVLAVAGGVRITAFIGDNLFMQIISVLWIVLITNSFNLLDNMDGLCAGTAAISAAVLGLVALDSGQGNLALALGALSGACIGFLRWNRAPASIFLGDAGSLLAGFLMACFTAMATYYHSGRASHLGIGIPLLILAIPLYDTFSVIWIRLRERRPVMRGDTSHFSHRLVDLGMSRRQAVGAIHLACLAVGLPATVLPQLSEARGFLIIGQAILILTLVAVLEHAGRARVRREPARTEHGESAHAPPSVPQDALKNLEQDDARQP